MMPHVSLAMACCRGRVCCAHEDDLDGALMLSPLASLQADQAADQIEGILLQRAAVDVQPRLKEVRAVVQALLITHRCVAKHVARH